jgi:hypothetical protein
MLSAKPDAVLENGTVIRHRTIGYEGTVDGITQIRECFTSAGEQLGKISSKYAFQYRIIVAGESLRKIAPAEDLEVLEQTSEVRCARCTASFQTKLGAVGKPAGRCQCGEWICPYCWSCSHTAAVPTADRSPCVHERKRLVKKSSAARKLKNHTNTA